MKISPININSTKPSFAGKYVYTDPSSDLTRFPEWHSTSYTETTLGSYHADKKNRVYFADPLEPITDKIKESADKIVYEAEPSYPDVNKEVSRNYFGTERKNYKDVFEDIRMYHYRKEMGGFADVNEAKYQQWQAAECVRLYDKGGHLRYVKERAEDAIKTQTAYNEANAEDLRAIEDELKQQKNIKSQLEEHIENLNKMTKPYAAVIKAANAGTEKELALGDSAKLGLIGIEHKHKKNKGESATWNSVVNVYEGIKNAQEKDYTLSSAAEKNKEEQNALKAATEKYTALKSKCEDAIAVLNKRVEGLKARMNNTNKEIENSKALIEDCKAKLIPIFDELKNFYAKQGIKVIKNI